MGKLDGAVAVITGASSGIGHATAVALAQQGATVALLARNSAKLHEIAAQMENSGGTALVSTVDVTRPDEVSEAMAAIASETGSIDILVNSAGMTYNSSAEHASVRQWQKMVDANVMGVLHASHAALPYLLTAAQGSRGVADVVNIGSMAGHRAMAHNGVYAATKHAVRAFSESLRQEVTSRHVRVCVVSPGMVRTPMTSDFTGQRYEFDWLEAEDIAEGVSFVVTRPRRASINDMMIRPTEQQT